MDIIWKDVVGFEGLYEVSCSGEIRNKKNGQLLNGGTIKKGYKRISLRKDKMTYQFLVHRIVAEAFIPNPDQKKFIDHVNTIASDNRVENLRWCDYAENNNNPITKKKISASKSGKNHPLYGKRHKRETIDKMKNSAKNIPVIQVSKNGKVLKEWNSIAEAERETGIPHGNISKCCCGERKTAGRYVWRYKNEPIF